VGWVTFDPTPRSAFEVQIFGASSWTSKYFDALRMRWNRYVIDYNVGDQAMVAMSLRRQSTLFGQNLGRRWGPWWFKIQRAMRRFWEERAYLMGILLALIPVGLLLFRKLSVATILPSGWLFSARTRRNSVAFYERMLGLLVKRGLPRPLAATAREYASTLTDRPELYLPVVELTALYERVRFGGEPLAHAEEQRVDTLLQSLASAPR
ncbi:MAG TPA: DUF4129 domain-containing protein, partial [Candidatus Methylomirabilis sp.]|nr:DUF4129 domain-containing protein [Candidatus Methylomirabilis sp.]